MEFRALPRSVQVAGLSAVAVAVTGVLLIVAGTLDLHWWGTPSAHRLNELLDQIRVVWGDNPPAMLRGGGGAVELIVLGACCLAYAGLGPLILRGRRWARTAGVLLGCVTLLVGLVEIGVDASYPVDVRAYLETLGTQGAGEMVPQVRGLLYPSGYNWFEDVAQGLQALAAAVTVGALTLAAVWHPHFFGGKGNAVEAPDEWSAAISRIREENARRREETGLAE